MIAMKVTPGSNPRNFARRLHVFVSKLKIRAATDLPFKTLGKLATPGLVATCPPAAREATLDPTEA
jgi:hypothetical protein